MYNSPNDYRRHQEGCQVMFVGWWKIDNFWWWLKDNYCWNIICVWNRREGDKQCSRRIEILQWSQKLTEMNDGLDMEERADSNQTCYAIDKKGLDLEDSAYSNQMYYTLQFKSPEKTLWTFTKSLSFTPNPETIPFPTKASLPHPQSNNYCFWWNYWRSWQYIVEWACGGNCNIFNTFYFFHNFNVVTNFVAVLMICILIIGEMMEGNIIIC